MTWMSDSERNAQARREYERQQAEQAEQREDAARDAEALLERTNGNEATALLIVACQILAELRDIKDKMPIKLLA